MNSVYQVIPSTNLDAQLGFQAQSAVIDNNTNQWAYQPDAGRWIQPYSTANAVTIPYTQRAQVVWQAPPGIVQPTVNSGEQLTATFYDIPISQPSQNSFSPAPAQALVATFNSAQGETATIHGPFTCPTGTQGLIVVWKDLTQGASGAAPDLVAVLDSSQEIVWGSANPNVTAGGVALAELSDTLLQVPFAYQVNNQIVVEITEPTGTSHTWWVIATFIPTSLGVQIQGSDVQIPVFFANPGVTWTTSADASITTTASDVAVANTSRKGLLLENTGNNNIRLQFTSNPTSTTGFRLLPSQGMTISSPDCPTAQLNAITETGTSTLSVTSWQ